MFLSPLQVFQFTKRHFPDFQRFNWEVSHSGHSLIFMVIGPKSQKNIQFVESKADVLNISIALFILNIYRMSVSILTDT